MTKPRIKYDYNIDAWQNSASGMGISGVDKTLNSSFGVSSILNQQQMGIMHRYDWLTRKITDRPANDATKRFISLDDTRINTELERLRLRQKCRDAISWSRLYGGAGIVIIADDGKEASEPLEPAKVRRVVDLLVVDRNYLTAEGIDSDIFSTTYGEPEFFRVNGGELFHRSRVMQFEGVPLTYDQRINEFGWGGSYVQLYSDAVRQFQGSVQDARHIMTESGVGILKIPGLTNSTSHGGTIADAIGRRVSQFNRDKSVYRVAAMDDVESFEFVHRQLNGLSDLLDVFMNVVSGATDMPALVLFGKSPAGLNSSQEEIMSVYYDMVRNIQEGDMMNAINVILSCLNGGVVPEWDYKPLSEPSSSQMATIRLQEAQAAEIVQRLAGLTGEAVIEHLNGTGAFALDVDDGEELPPGTELDIE